MLVQFCQKLSSLINLSLSKLVWTCFFLIFPGERDPAKCTGFNRQNLSKLVQTCRNLSNFVNSCPALNLSELFLRFAYMYFSKLVQTCLNLSNFVKSCPDLSQLVFYRWMRSGKMYVQFNCQSVSKWVQFYQNLLII